MPRNPNSKAPKTPAAQKSPGKVTNNESAQAKKLLRLTKVAKQRADATKMTSAQLTAISNARKQLSAMRKQLADKGYGDTFKTKAGGVGGRGIYKELTGKPSPLKKPSTPNRATPKRRKKDDKKA